MAVRDLAVFDDWISRSSPSSAARAVVGSFIVELADAPWAAPSAEIPPLSSKPEYDVRAAQLDVPEGRVWIVYRHTHRTDDVDLLGIMDDLVR